MDNTFLEDSPILKTPAKINPYKEARWLFVNRFKWDLRPVAWASRKKLRKLQDKYAGKKAVIMCNGPSLNKVDFDKLKNVYTFGLNKINLLFNRTDFRPSAIAVVNGHVMEQNAPFYNETEIPLFLDTCGLKHVKFRENVHFMHATDTAKFSRDISGSIWKGGTVTFAAMQLAFHMGFTKVALVGCDHYFNAVGAANQLAVSNGKDDSHFDPNYFSGGMKWQLPDIAASEYSYSMAREMYAASDRLLLNATEGGHLTLLPRVDLDTFLDDKF